MKKSEIQTGLAYVAKVSNILAVVRLVQENPMGGWDAINVATGRGVRIKTAGRLRRRPTDTEIIAAQEHRRGY